MFFKIDLSNGLAIYQQVARQVKFAVAGGALKAGELVPSVRELARELAINPNTVARAYRRLQAEAGADEQCRSERVELIRERLQQVLVEARQSRLEADQLRALVEGELAAIEQLEV